jgi:RND family efflux transporter MFP subunit
MKASPRVPNCCAPPEISMMCNRFSKTLLVLAIAAAACTHRETPAERETVDAPVVIVQRASLPSIHSIAGTVRSETTSTLAANVVGTIVRVPVAEGDRVRAGQILVEIDSRAPRAEVERAYARRDEIEHAIAAATANAQLAEAAHRRFSALHERGSASEQEYDEAKAKYAAAQAELNGLAAKRNEVHAAARAATAVLAFSSVRAPIDGVITARFVDPGAQAAPGVPLVRIERETATRVDAYVPEQVTVRVGDRANIRFGDRRIEARVTHVQPSVDPAARSALVKLRLAQPLRAGTSVNVSFAIGTRDSVTVPTAALVHRGQLTSVFVVDADGVARMRMITLGATEGANAEILSGLTAGEQIVSVPHRVRDGVVVRRKA